MNKLAKSFLVMFLVASFLIPSISYGQEFKGQVSYSYKGSTFSSSPSSKDKKAALDAAKKAAWNQYISTFNVSKQQQYRKIEKKVVSNLDDYINSYKLVINEVNKSTQTLNMVVRINVNENRLNSELKETTTAGTMSSGEGSLFSSIFVARQIIESKTFKARETNVSQSDKSTSASRNVSTNSNLSVKEKTSNVSMNANGGNTVLKSAQNKYGSLSSIDFDSAFNEVLTQMGYETIDYSDVASECNGPNTALITADFLNKDQLNDSIRKKIINAAKECDVKFLSIGSMNVSAPQIDSVSGNQKVVVSITGMVWNIAKKLPRKVGSVGPVQFIGLGPDQDTARRNALKSAAQSAAESISSQLGSKNLY